ncbi:MAG: glycosyltransferase [Acidimicrobiia bacterium]|nr:glycosyltransferase [Acidimicrobiia bacterium]
MSSPAAGELADHLASSIVSRLESLAAGPLAGWLPPPVYGGHRVGADVTADLAWTVAHLHRAGVDRVGETSIEDVLRTALGAVRGSETHTFFSYRVAEAAALGGPLDDNWLLVDTPSAQIGEIAAASDSTDWVPLLDGGLPRNYAAVLARCEHARRRLGLAVDPELSSALVDRTRQLLGGDEPRPLDDSEDHSGRYDIYAIDVVLFCEPLADELGGLWQASARQAVDLAALSAQRNGATVTWGRSTGALSLCLTVELAALAHRHGLVDDPRPWFRRARIAADALAGWFDDGVISAHRHRSPYGYRGPERRLQMTLDCLGKLAWSAAQLRQPPLRPPTSQATGDDPEDDAFPAIDHLHRFETERHAAVWAYRDRRCAVVVPFVGGWRSDYLAAPSYPGHFEVPVDRPLACWLPTVVPVDALHPPVVPAGPPDELTHRSGSVRASWSAFTALAGTDGTAPFGRPDHLVRSIRIEGRTVVLDDHLTPADDAAWAVVSIPETSARPLVVEVSGEQPDRRHVVSTDGIKEWRSFWGPLPVVHELAWSARTPRHWQLRVTPAVRVASEDAGHHYHRSLYDPLATRVREHRFPAHLLDRPDAGADRLRDVDVFHLHWPEWFVGDDVDRMLRFCDLLDRLGVPLLWTQHNLIPHWQLPAFEDLYAAVATRAAAVIHHSEWGMQRALDRWDYSQTVTHRVIPHGHFGNLLGSWDDDQRRAARRRAEATLELAPCSIRIGIVGAPRADKDVVGFARAFAATTRSDLGLLVASARPEELEQIPDDERITALPYEFVDRDTYNERLAAIDVLALPFRADGQMLTTGVVGDAVGLGVGVLCTSWPYLHEMLGDAAIDIGDDEPAYTTALEALDTVHIRRAAEVATQLRDRYAWPVVAEATFELLEELLPPP